MPTFPRATYFVNRMEWEDATSGSPELAGSYPAENFAPLWRIGPIGAGRWRSRNCPRLVDPADRRPHAWAPGLAVRVGQRRGSCTSAISARSFPNLRRMWITAYDLYPLETRRRKPELLGEAADRGWWVLWDHEPTVAVSRLARHAGREFIVTDARAEL